MLTFDEAYERLPANGWLTRPEARMLWDTVNRTTGQILEVGVYYGRSTALLTATDRLVHCVDPFDNFDSDHDGDYIEEQFYTRMNERGISNFILYRRRIEDMMPLLFGFAYLDGDHTYEGTLSQLQYAAQMGVKIACIHDAVSTDVMNAIRDNECGWLIKDSEERMAVIEL